MKSFFTAALALATAQASQYDQHHYMYNNAHSGHAVMNANNAQDPWTPLPAGQTAPTGWYSPTQQYSKPRIAFVPGPSKDIEYSICSIDTATDATIEFAQLPGKSSTAKISMTGGTASATYNFELHKQGDISGAACANVGEIFNPLKEFNKYGHPNPFQDPKRGAIGSVTVDAAGDLSANLEQNILLNLSGEDSVIGRSIVMYENSAPTTVVGCCVIGIADDGISDIPHHHHYYVTPKPVYVTPKPVYVTPKPVYVTPKPTYVAPKPAYSTRRSYSTTTYKPAPKPVYTTVRPTTYTTVKPAYVAPKPVYVTPKPVPVYVTPVPVYGSPQPTYRKVYNSGYMNI